MNLFTSLRYLSALHQHKHFGRAADACCITQPAFSNAIRALEEEFGCAIVKRGRSFESFTPEGERIFVSAQRMLHEQELLLQELKGTAEQPVGALTLGAVPSVMPIAARFAGHLHTRFPGLSLTVRSMSSPEIEAGLEHLSVDIGLGYTDRLKSRAARLKIVNQYTERYFLLRRASKPAESGLHIASCPATWEMAARLPLCLLTPEMHNRTIVDATFKQIGIPVQPVIETNSILTLGLTVLVGEVCSILPGALVAVLRGCGLCGTESLAHAMRPLEPLATSQCFGATAVVLAAASLRDNQCLLAVTGATHAAAWCTADGHIELLREDVGRHNALDKLVGALLRSSLDASSGFVIITSRASYEMVQKTASVGISLLAAVSGVTGLAVDVAQDAGLTLLGFTRGADFSIYSHPERLSLE